MIGEMTHTSREVKAAMDTVRLHEKARGGWTKDDLAGGDDKIKDADVNRFAIQVIESFSKEVLEKLITSQAEKETMERVARERNLVGMKT